MKLIVLVNQNLNKTNLDRFSLKYDKQNHFEKLFWSILPLNNRALFLEYEKPEYRSKKNKNFINIKNYYELYQNLKKIKKNTYFLNLSDGYFKSLFIELFMKFKGCIILRKIEWYVNSNSKENLSKKISRLYRFGLLLTIKKLLNALLFLLKKILLRIFSCKPDYFIIENQKRELELKKKNIDNFIKVNSYTYYSFNKIKSKKDTKNYFVFLDSEIENSFESKVLKNKHNFSDQSNYWKCLDNIFNNLSEKFNIDVKIAAHFRRSKKNCPINKKFYFDQTLELIKNSKFVVVQNSSTIDWAVLLKKPILLLNFKFFDSIALENSDSIKWYRDKLSLEIVNVDLNYNFHLRNKMNSLLKIDEKKYQKFSHLYLNYKTQKSSNMSQWDMIYNEFK